jgi:hypothetical protein
MEVQTTLSALCIEHCEPPQCFLDLGSGPVYSVVESYIVSPEEPIAPGSGLTIIPIEMVSNPSSPEAIEPFQKQEPGELIKPSPP